MTIWTFEFEEEDINIKADGEIVASVWTFEFDKFAKIVAEANKAAAQKRWGPF